MKINYTGFGNKELAYIEKRFDNKTILTSVNNNKGKTLVMQSLLAPLGNNAIWPEGFNWEDFYFVTSVSVNELEYVFLLKNKSYMVSYDSNIKLFNNASDLRTFLNGNLFELPRIEYHNRESIVYPELFYELFFLGSDKRDTSNVSSFYSKKYFYSMIENIFGIQADVKETTTDELITQVENVSNKIKMLRKKSKLLKSRKESISYLNKSANRNKYEKLQSEVEEIQAIILEDEKDINNNIINLNKTRQTISEINSLKNTSSETTNGRFICLDCESENIGYKVGELTFEISNKEIRKRFMHTLKTMEADTTIEISNLKERVNIQRDKIKSLMKENDVTFEELVYSISDIESVEDIDNELEDLFIELERLKVQRAERKVKKEKSKISKAGVLRMIVSSMNEFASKLVQEKPDVYNSILTKDKVVYSGSQATEYYVARMLAFQLNMKHNFPIIIDGLREGGVSSSTEKRIIDELSKLSNQVILSATLKEEEADVNKYDNYLEINHLNYENYETKQIMQASYVEELQTLLSKFGVKF